MTTTTTTIIQNKQRFSPAKLLLEGRAFVALILIIVVFSLLSPNYLTVENLLIMASHVAIYAMLGLGMLMVILNGGIDLSVGSTLGFSAVIAGFLLQGVPINFLGFTLVPSVPVVVLLSCGVGAAVGFVNGILVARFKVAPFVATLGMLYVVRGLALLMTNGLTINDLAGDEGLGNTGFDWLGFNRILGIPIGVIIMGIVALILGFVLGRTKFGRWLYASGGNERAAELSGVPVRKVKVWVYVISGVCASIAGLILASTLTSASPTAGNTYELTAIATVVIGGAALTGGRGNVRGTLLGAFVIGFLGDGLVIVGVSAYWQMVLIGAVIVLAVLLNTLQYGRRRKAPAPGSGTPAGPGTAGPSATGPSAASPGAAGPGTASATPTSDRETAAPAATS